MRRRGAPQSGGWPEAVDGESDAGILSVAQKAWVFALPGCVAVAGGLLFFGLGGWTVIPVLLGATAFSTSDYWKNTDNSSFNLRAVGLTIMAGLSIAFAVYALAFAAPVLLSMSFSIPLIGSSINLMSTAALVILGPIAFPMIRSFANLAPKETSDAIKAKIPDAPSILSKSYLQKLVDLVLWCAERLVDNLIWPGIKALWEPVLLVAGIVAGVEAMSMVIGACFFAAPLSLGLVSVLLASSIGISLFAASRWGEEGMMMSVLRFGCILVTSFAAVTCLVGLLGNLAVHVFSDGLSASVLGPLGSGIGSGISAVWNAAVYSWHGIESVGSHLWTFFHTTLPNTPHAISTYVSGLTWGQIAVGVGMVAAIGAAGGLVYMAHQTFHEHDKRFGEELGEPAPLGKGDDQKTSHKLLGALGHNRNASSAPSVDEFKGGDTASPDTPKDRDPVFDRQDSSTPFRPRSGSGL